MLAEDDDEEYPEEDGYDEDDEEGDDDDTEEFSEDEIEAMLAEDDDCENDEDSMLSEGEEELGEEDLVDDDDLADEIEAMLAEDEYEEIDDEISAGDDECIDPNAVHDMLNAKGQSKSFSATAGDDQEDIDVEGLNEYDIEAMLSDDESSEVKNILEETDFSDLEEGFPDIESEDFQDNEEQVPDFINDTPRVKDISEDDQIEVDLVEDGMTNEESLSNSTVNLLYVPSETVNNHRWYAIVNDTPVAMATAQSVGPQKSGIFATDNFRKATEVLMAQIGIAPALRDMGFQSLKINLPIKRVVEAQVQQAVAAANAISHKEIANMRNDIKAALATASVGINKGFFSRLSNPIKAELYDALSTAGVRNAEILIDDAFCSRSDDYHRSLIEQAFDLLKKPVEARNEISHAVMTANYQRSSVEDSSLSHSVSKQLSSFGSTSVSNAELPATNQPSFNERASQVIKGLLR